MLFPVCRELCQSLDLSLSGIPPMWTAAAMGPRLHYRRWPAGGVPWCVQDGVQQQAQPSQSFGIGLGMVRIL
jgi:hypothetical protein